MGEAFLTRRGALESEGLYVWKKYEMSFKDISHRYSSPPTVLLSNSDTYIWHSDEYYIDEGKFCLLNPQYINMTISSVSTGYCITDEYEAIDTSKTVKTLKSGKYLHKIEQKINTSIDPFTTLISLVEYEYHTIETGKTFIDYIVSDNETKYPDGDVQDGYYYERVNDIKEVLTCGFFTKVAIDEFTPASNTNIPVITHSLGVLPKAVIILPMYNTPSSTSDVVSIFGTFDADGADYWIYNFNPSLLGASYSSRYSTATTTQVKPRVNTGGFKAGKTYKVITMA